MIQKKLEQSEYACKHVHHRMYLNKYIFVKNLQKGIDVCFYNQANNQSLDDYCYKTYHSSAVGYYCMPMELNNVKRSIIEADTKSTFNKMKIIAGDIWRVKHYFILMFRSLYCN